MALEILISLGAFIILVLQLPKIKKNKKKTTPIIIAIIAFIVMIFSVFKSCNDKKDSNKNKEFQFRSTQEHKEINTKLDDSKDPALVVKKGFSFYLALTQNEIIDFRRKYIFDFGESVTNNRISLYFDAENNLIFRIIDKIGEQNTCTVPNSSYTFNTKTPFFIYCDCGVSDSYSFMRIRINDREVYRSGGIFEIKYIENSFFDPLKKSSFSMVRKLPQNVNDKSNKIFFNNYYFGSICADLNGENNSSFYPLEIQAFGWLNKKETIDSIWTSVKKSVFPYSDFFLRTLAPIDKTYKIINGNIVLVEK